MNTRDDLDKKLMRIAKSTQTLFPFFIRPHDWLRMHSKLYYRWHVNPWATFTHVMLLIVVTGVNLLNLSSFIISYPTSAQAASQTWSSQSDWNGWTRSDTSETVTSGSLTLSSNGSNSWSTQSSPTSSGLNGVWAASASDVWAVGDSGTIIHYNGSSWSTVTSGTSTTLNEIWGASSSDIWAVGNSGTVVHYNGSSWSSVTSNTANTLRAVWGSGASDVWATGDSGTIIRYNGSSWSTSSSGTSYSLYGVWGSSSSDIWAVGAGGATPTTIRWNGSSWSAVFTTLPTTAFYGIWGTSSSNYHATTANNAQAHYGGSSWAYDYGSPSTAATRYGMWGTSASDIWIVGGSGEIQHFNGSTWSASTSNTSTTLRDVWGSGSSDVWAVGGSGTLVHYGSGYSSSGTATKVLTPGSGQTYDWESATVNKTTNSQTATVEYTTNTNCSSSLTTDISALADSESICVKVSLSTNNTGVTPSIEDITISYSAVSASSSSSTATPSSSSTSTGTGTGSGTGTGTGKAKTASPSPTPTLNPSITPVVKKIAKDTCTTEIKDITISSQDTLAQLVLTTIKPRGLNVYLYPENRAIQANQSAVGFETNSTVLGYETAKTTHEVSIPNLKAETTYYLTVAARAIKGSAKAVSCEYSFTTVASASATLTLLSGNVYEEGTKTPVPNVAVSFQRKSAVDATWKGFANKTSDAAGSFAFEYTPSESYYVNISAPAGYYLGPTRGDSSCVASQRGPNALAWEKGLFLPNDGCRVSFYLTKIQDSWPVLSGKILENGKTNGIRDARLQLVTYGKAGSQILTTTTTNDTGEWSFKYPPALPIGVIVPTDPFRLAGPTKAVYGCKGDNNATTNTLRWQKTLLPASTGECKNNIFYTTLTQPLSPPLSGSVKDAATGIGIPDARIDIFSLVKGEKLFAARRYTDKDGKWRVLAKPDTIYQVSLYFESGHTLGYIPGPSVVASNCQSSRASIADITLAPLTQDGCHNIDFSANPLASSSSKILSGYTLNDITNEPVPQVNVRLARFDPVSTNWHVVSNSYTDSKGQWQFPIIPGEKYFVETRYTPGYLTGFKLPTSSCNTDTKYTYRLTWLKTILKNDCQSNVFYMTPGDGKITGTVAFPNSLTPYFNSLQRLWSADSKGKSLQALQYTYSDNKGRFSLDCRRGFNYYKLKQDPISANNTHADAIIDTGTSTSRTAVNQSRNTYIPIQPNECREPENLKLAVTITPNGGTFEKEVRGIRLSYTSTVPGHKADIHYCFDCSTVTRNHPKWRGRDIVAASLPQQGVNQSLKLKAVAFGSESETVEATYNLVASLPTPSPTTSPTATSSPDASPSPSSEPSLLDVTAKAAGDLYKEPVTVTLSTNEPPSSDITILYSTDGSDPADGGKVYTDPIAFNSSVTLNFFAKKTSTGQQSTLKTESYTFPETAPVLIAWTPNPSPDLVYTLSCNGEAIAETRAASYENPVRQLDGCVYTVTAKDKDGNSLGEVKGITVSAAKPAKTAATAVNITPVAAAAAAGAVAVASIQPGIIRSLGLLPFLLHSLWLWLMALLGIRKKHSSWGRVYETALDSPISNAIVSFYRLDNRQPQLVDRQLSARDGSYGFLIAPGQYRVDVKKTGFVFPSRATKSSYNGTAFSLTDQREMKIDLPMDPFELSHSTLTRWRKIRTLLEKLNYPLLVAGSALTIYDLTKGVTAIGIIVILIYTALWANKISHRTKKESHG